MPTRRSLLSPTDFIAAELEKLFCLADEIIASPDKFSDACHGKMLATLFYEPSTRTRLSFEAAMHRLGGAVFGFSDPASSSVSKGETIADTARMISCYADIVAMRHPLDGAPQAADLYANIPIINAGDGKHQHPTQTHTDMYTIRRSFGRLDHLRIGLCGDLKYGRTVHSLIDAMSRYQDITFVCISPKELALPEYIEKTYGQLENIHFEWEQDLEQAIAKVDVLYMTRIQRERFDDLAQYERLKGVYVLDAAKMQLAKKDMIVLHPLPRVDEITTDVDDDPRAMYFTQAQYGMYVRMALIYTLLNIQTGQDALGAKMHLGRRNNTTCTHNGYVCPNPKCICNVETGLPARFVQKGNHLACYYCDSTAEEK